MSDFVEGRLKHCKLMKLKDPESYVPEVTRTLVMIQQARTPMGVSLDLQRLVRRGELRFEQAAKELVERFKMIHKKEREHLRISSQIGKSTSTQEPEEEEVFNFQCNIRDLQAVRSGGIMIDGLACMSAASAKVCLRDKHSIVLA